VGFLSEVKKEQRNPSEDGFIAIKRKHKMFDDEERIL
jgi:hypothetical protein